MSLNWSNNCGYTHFFLWNILLFRYIDSHSFMCFLWLFIYLLYFSLHILHFLYPFWDTYGIFSAVSGTKCKTLNAVRLLWNIWSAHNDFQCRREFSVTCCCGVNVASLVEQFLENPGKLKISAMVRFEQKNHVPCWMNINIDNGSFMWSVVLLHENLLTWFVGNQNEPD